MLWAYVGIQHFVVWLWWGEKMQQIAVFLTTGTEFLVCKIL